MKKACIIGVSLLITTSAAAMETARPSRLRHAYRRTHDRLSKHKGKVGLACGAVGAGLAYKIFHKEFDMHVKPLIKGVWKRFTGWCKRIFRRKKD